MGDFVEEKNVVDRGSTCTEGCREGVVGALGWGLWEIARPFTGGVRSERLLRHVPTGDGRRGPRRPHPAVAVQSEDFPGQATQRPYVATTAQVWSLHDAFAEHLRPAVLLGACAGLRTSEVVALRVADVDFMRVEGAMRVARASVDGLPDGFRFHDLRHYFASLLIGSGADVKVVQRRLRHASATTTLNTYSHMWPDADESARAAVGAVLAARADSLSPTSCGLSAD